MTLSEIFETEEVYDSIQDFLYKQQHIHNLTGNHTRVLYEVVFDDSVDIDIYKELERIIDNLEQPALPFSDIYGYLGFDLELDNWYHNPFKNKLAEVLEYKAGYRYENLQTVIECRYVNGVNAGNFLYTFYINVLLDAEDDFKPKACVINVLLFCVREIEDSQWMRYHPIVDDLPDNLLDIEQLTFNQMMKISKQYWLNIGQAVWDSIGKKSKNIEFSKTKLNQQYLFK